MEVCHWQPPMSTCQMHAVHSSDKIAAALDLHAQVVQFDQTFTLAASIVVRSEEVRHRYKRQSSFLLQVRYNVETVLTVLLVLFLLASGSWGYRRYRG